MRQSEFAAANSAFQADPDPRPTFNLRQRCSNVQGGNSQFNGSTTTGILIPSGNFAIRHAQPAREGVVATTK